MDHVEVRLLLQLLLGIAEQPADRRIGTQEAPADREHRDPRSGLLEQRPEQQRIVHGEHDKPGSPGKVG